MENLELRKLEVSFRASIGSKVGTPREPKKPTDCGIAQKIHALEASAPRVSPARPCGIVGAWDGGF